MPERLVSTPQASAQRPEDVVDRPVLGPLVGPLGDDLMGSFEVARAFGGQCGVPKLEWRWRKRRVRTPADHDDRRSIRGRDRLPHHAGLDRDQGPRGGLHGLPGDGERRGPGSDQLKLLVPPGARAGLVMRLDCGLARIGAVSVDGESCDRERTADGPPHTVVERDLLELVQMRALVTGHRCQNCRCSRRAPARWIRILSGHMVDVDHRDRHVGMAMYACTRAERPRLHGPASGRCGEVVRYPTANRARRGVVDQWKILRASRAFEMRLAGFEPATRGLEDGSWFR
jgi:hypothetical protein